MLSRRKLFNALTAPVAIGGLALAAHRADAAVAHAFEDADYLQERKARLAKHAAEMDRIDAERATRVAKQEAKYVIIDSYKLKAQHATARGVAYTTDLPLAHYDLLCEVGMVDFIPNAEGSCTIPTFLGTPMKVIGLT